MTDDADLATIAAALMALERGDASAIPIEAREALEHIRQRLDAATKALKKWDTAAPQVAQALLEASSFLDVESSRQKCEAALLVVNGDLYELERAALASSSEPVEEPNGDV